MASVGQSKFSGQFDTDLTKGLTPAQVQDRISQYGYNEVIEKKESTAKRLLKKFSGVTPWMLEITIVLLWFTGKHLEMYVVAGLLVTNAILGFIQEGKAYTALDSLKQRLRVSARVIRDGQWSMIPARELVPGDVVRIRGGDFVPADVKVKEGGIEVDQSSLTGESATVEKKIGDDLFSGSTAKRGECTGIVISTGTKTYFGQTVELVQIARPKLHMEEVTSRVVRWLVIVVAILISVALIFTTLKGINVVQVLPLAIVLLVSAIPVALPTMFTISMALGSLELARKGVLVTRLSASEDAATMSVLCADKTGTMTMNKLSVAKVLTSEGYTKDDVILYGTLASQEANQDAIDLAFISAARDIRIPLEGYSQKNFIPFDATTRRTESTIEREGKQFRVLKGAVSTIVQLCSCSPEEVTRLENESEKLESQGYRMVAVATDAENTNTKLVGAVALYDKPRADSARLIANLKDLGISVKMLTGDALPVAREIAKQLGLGSNIVKVSETRAQLKDDKALEHLEKSDGFAEIFPEDKYLIVKHLQKRGYSVGMTGDGVNDAPALKQAEVGIAVASATDVAKESASVVLTSEGLESIVELVKRGRMIYQRITTWVLNKIVKTFQIVVFVIIAYMLTREYVVSVFSMILLLFLTDFVTLSLSTDNVRYSTKPDTWNIAGLTKVAVFLGIMMVLESFILLHIGSANFGLGGSIGKLQTFVFDFLVLLSLFNVLIVRERKHFWESKPSRFLIAAIVADALIVVLISVLGIPELNSISLVEALFVLAYSALVCFLVNDFVKVRLIKRFM